MNFCGVNFISRPSVSCRSFNLSFLSVWRRSFPADQLGIYCQPRPPQASRARNDRKAYEAYLKQNQMLNMRTPRYTRRLSLTKHKKLDLHGCQPSTAAKASHCDVTAGKRWTPHEQQLPILLPPFFSSSPVFKPPHRSLPIPYLPLLVAILPLELLQLTY